MFISDDDDSGYSSMLTFFLIIDWIKLLKIRIY